MFTVKVYTPNKIIIDGVEGLSIFAPTCQGEVNILPGHTHIVAKMVRGILRVITANREEGVYVESGFCRVLRDGVVFLVKGVIRYEDIDLDKVLEEKGSIEKTLAGNMGNLAPNALDELSSRLQKLQLLIRLNHLYDHRRVENLFDD